MSQEEQTEESTFAPEFGTRFWTWCDLNDEPLEYLCHVQIGTDCWDCIGRLEGSGKPFRDTGIVPTHRFWLDHMHPTRVHAILAAIKDETERHERMMDMLKEAYEGCSTEIKPCPTTSPASRHFTPSPGWSWSEFVNQPQSTEPTP